MQLLLPLPLHLPLLLKPQHLPPLPLLHLLQRLLHPLHLLLPLRQLLL
jgi:hypothetical protein